MLDDWRNVLDVCESTIERLRLVESYRGIFLLWIEERGIHGSGSNGIDADASRLQLLGAVFVGKCRRKWTRIRTSSRVLSKNNNYLRSTSKVLDRSLGTCIERIVTGKGSQERGDGRNDLSAIFKVDRSILDEEESTLCVEVKHQVEVVLTVEPTRIQFMSAKAQISIRLGSTVDALT